MASRVFGACGAMMMSAAKAGSRSSSLPSPSPAPKSASAPAATGAAKKPKAKAAKSAAPGSALLRPNPVSPALGDFMGGVSEASRSGAVKKIWEHIKANNLQDPANKKLIHCDAKLKTIFEGKDQVGFLEIAKLVSAHFIKSPSS
uniref:DM2 domain-containing protein n=1 Tax=Kalanchoe fedtschenkoi TaxID=63787 RepID=A0A7N0T074_KALFE